MYEQESKKVIHIMILLSHAILSGTMVIYTIVQGKEPLSVVFLLLAVAAGWIIHFTEMFSGATRLWIYTILLMLTFFYYGSHEQSVYDMAPIALGFILVYTPTDDRRFIRVAAFTYYFTMCYDFLFVPAGSEALPAYSIGRIAIHFAVVFLGEQVAEIIIRKRRREKKHIEETIARLEEANQSAEDFLANTSHELRTPINAVTGITSLMLKNEEDPSKRKDLLSIQIAGNRLFSQIEDILDYSEIDNGRISVSEEIYSITSLVNDIIMENRHMDRRLDAELIFDIDAKIPTALIGDGRKVKKILKHLTDNAMKFTKTGGVHVRIYALHRAYGINLCMCVSDTGVGIAGDELEKITERFFQSNGGRNRKNGGLGLGLPIVYGMVSAMDGFVQIESTEGAGTVVSVSIPQKVSDARPCMEVPGRMEQMSLACYLRPEKYEVPKVRDYYNVTISHMVRELELSVHRVGRLEELKRLVSAVKLSHLFIGNVEYEEDTAYFEQLGQTMEVVIIADESFRLSGESRLKVIRKPFCNLSIVNILNSAKLSEEGAAEREMLSCPGVRVLVVDDELMNLLVVEDIFKAWGMDVRTAKSGREAIDLCKNAEFDLIFLDHMMPEMDGVETLKELRKLWTNTNKRPVTIAFSANVVSGAREMFLWEGFDDFISKPLEDRELKRLLRRVLPESAILYASEGGEKDESNQPAAWRQELEAKGFRVEEGLQYCNQDCTLYEDVLIRFAQDSGRKIDQIEAALQNGDYQNYQILVHALKSSAKIVGADTLSELAKAAEAAAKDLDADYIHAHHGDLMERYREAAQYIGDVLQPAEAEDGAEIAKPELLEYLKKFKGALATYESDKADALLAEMSAFIYRGTPVHTLVQGIRQNVDDFEWEAATEQADALIGSLEGGEA